MQNDNILMPPRLWNFDTHAKLCPHAPTMTRHSPDGYVIIHECDCTARFLDHPLHDYIITMDPKRRITQ